MKTIKPLNLEIIETDLDCLSTNEGILIVLITPEGVMDPAARRVNKLTRGSLSRLISSKKFKDADIGHLFSINFPDRCAAEQICVLKIGRRSSKATARKAGVAIAKMKGSVEILLALGNFPNLIELCKGVMLREYTFDTHKTELPIKLEGSFKIKIMHNKPETLTEELLEAKAIRDGVFLTRNLINEPSNILTTEEFASRLTELSKLGVTVEILEEDDLHDLGMNAFLGVGQGSPSPSKLVVMRWSGAAKDVPPLALVGKGVVFDTGGISLKPAGGMEDMTMDMGGAAVVAGVMTALAKRKSPSNVVGIVGLVENMPSGTAQRPGDVVKSMKGDTIEVINTDAEGRLVLCDVMWYAQEKYKPSAMIDLATLTGAIIVSLGHENAGLFSNNDWLCKAVLKAADLENEGAWRMPLGSPYSKLLKSRVADIKNVGGRAAGSITAAAFLEKFVKPEIPWVHIDIAGVAQTKSESEHAPAGATGWGVMTLDTLVKNNFEEP